MICLHKKAPKAIRAVMLCAFAATAALLCSCETIFHKKEQPKAEVDLTHMTPEERDNYLAIQRARQRANEKIKLEAANGKPNDPNARKKEKDNDKWYKHLHSREKRKRLHDDRPVLLQDNTSIFEWRKDSPPRSEKLLKEGRQPIED